LFLQVWCEPVKKQFAAPLSLVILAATFGIFYLAGSLFKWLGNLDLFWLDTICLSLVSVLSAAGILIMLKWIYDALIDVDYGGEE